MFSSWIYRNLWLFNSPIKYKLTAVRDFTTLWSKTFWSAVFSYLKYEYPPGLMMPHGYQIIDLVYHLLSVLLAKCLIHLSLKVFDIPLSVLFVACTALLTVFFRWILCHLLVSGKMDPNFSQVDNLVWTYLLSCLVGLLYQFHFVFLVNLT